MKGKMDADSCATANIIDEVTLSKIQAKLTSKIELKPATTKLYAYAQQKPIDLVGCFDALIENARTRQETTAEFLVVKGKTTSRPLLSLGTSVKLGILHLTNKVQAIEIPQNNQYQKH